MPVKITLLFYIIFLTGLSPKLAAQSPWTYVGDLDATVTQVGFGQCGELLVEAPKGVYQSEDEGVTWAAVVERSGPFDFVKLVHTPNQALVLSRAEAYSLSAPACATSSVKLTSLIADQLYRNNVSALVTIQREIYVLQDVYGGPRAADSRPFTGIKEPRGSGEVDAPYASGRLVLGAVSKDSLFLQQPHDFRRSPTDAPLPHKPLGIGRPAGADTLVYSSVVSLDAPDTLVTVWSRAGASSGFIVARNVIGQSAWQLQTVTAGQLLEVRSEGSLSMAILTNEAVWFAADKRTSAFAKTITLPADVSLGQLDADGTRMVSVLPQGRLQIVSNAGVQTLGRPRIGNGAGLLQTTAAGRLLAYDGSDWNLIVPGNPKAAPTLVDLTSGVDTRLDTVGARAYRQVWTDRGTFLLNGPDADADTIFRSAQLETFEFVGSGDASRIFLRADRNRLVADGRVSELPARLQGALDVIGTDTLLADGFDIQLLAAAGRVVVPLTNVNIAPDAEFVQRVYREGKRFFLAYTQPIAGPSARYLFAFAVDPAEPQQLESRGGSLDPVFLQLGDKLYVGSGTQTGPLFGLQPTVSPGVALPVPTKTTSDNAGICFPPGANSSITCAAYASGVRGIVRLGDRVYISGDGGIYSQSVVCGPLDTVRLDTAIAVSGVLAGVRVDRVGQLIPAELPIAGSACKQPIVYRVTQVVGVGSPASLRDARVYPNPVAATLRIDGLLTDGVATTVVVRDLLGRVVVPMQTSAGVNEVTVDFSMLAGGVYLVQVTRPEGSRVWKVQRE